MNWSKEKICAVSKDVGVLAGLAAFILFFHAGVQDKLWALAAALVCAACVAAHNIACRKKDEQAQVAVTPAPVISPPVASA